MLGLVCELERLDKVTTALQAWALVAGKPPRESGLQGWPPASEALGGGSLALRLPRETLDVPSKGPPAEEYLESQGKAGVGSMEAKCPAKH